MLTCPSSSGRVEESERSIRVGPPVESWQHPLIPCFSSGSGLRASVTLLHLRHLSEERGKAGSYGLCDEWGGNDHENMHEDSGARKF